MPRRSPARKAIRRTRSPARKAIRRTRSPAKKAARRTKSPAKKAVRRTRSPVKKAVRRTKSPVKKAARRTKSPARKTVRRTKSPARKTARRTKLPRKPTAPKPRLRKPTAPKPRSKSTKLEFVTQDELKDLFGGGLNTFGGTSGTEKSDVKVKKTKRRSKERSVSMIAVGQRLLAEKAIKLKPHQLNIVGYLSRQVKGLVVFHGLGSGKTLTSIGVAELYKNKEVVVVTPASLRNNFIKELEKFEADLTRYNVVSYEKFADLVPKEFRKKREAIGDPNDLELEMIKTKDGLMKLRKETLLKHCVKHFGKAEEDPCKEGLSVNKLVQLIQQVEPNYSIPKGQSAKKQVLEKCRSLLKIESKCKSSLLKADLVELLDPIRENIRITEGIEEREASKILEGKILIIDEAHRLRNHLRMATKMIIREAKYADKVIMLTGTPIVNHPSDISPLVNILSKRKDYLPIGRVGFESKFGVIREGVIKNEHILRKTIRNKFSYYVVGDSSDYPRVTKHYEDVPMTAKQQVEYKKIQDQEGVGANEIAFFKSNTSNVDMDPDDEEEDTNKQAINIFINKTRKISNLAGGEKTSDKIKKIVDYIKKGPLPAVVYSNFLDGGVKPVNDIVSNELKLRTRLFTGETTENKKKQYVEDYNNKNVDVLFISGAGAEGLDLKGTRQMHIMEPAWNMSIINQVVGRGVRYKSHSHLPEKERHVDVYYWTSIYDSKDSKETGIVYKDGSMFIKGKEYISADKYLYIMSLKKQEISDLYTDIIQQESIENRLSLVVKDSKDLFGSSIIRKTSSRSRSRSQKIDIDKIQRGEFL